MTEDKTTTPTPTTNADQAKAAAEAKAKAETEAEAKTLGIPASKCKFGGVKPDKKDKEIARHDKLAATRLAARVEKAKAKAKLSEVQQRRLLLEARLRKYRDRRQKTNYTIETVRSWMKELEFIKKSPKAWFKGCITKGKEPSLDQKLDAVLGKK